MKHGRQTNIASNWESEYIRGDLSTIRHFCLSVRLSGEDLAQAVPFGMCLVRVDVLCVIEA